MKTILSVVVGSRLHGLNNETSDYDIRGIFVNPIKQVLSPYQKVKNTTWLEGNEDNTAYELADFCKFATQGNATILEILYSDQIRETTGWGDLLIQNRTKFLDSERIYEAHKGYAQNQYNKMNLFEPDARTPKFVVAYIRVLLQAQKLLATGSYDGWLDDDMKAFLLDIKYNFRIGLVPQITQTFVRLQTELMDVYAAHRTKYKPDLEWIDQFIYSCYMAMNTVQMEETIGPATRSHQVFQVKDEAERIKATTLEG